MAKRKRMTDASTADRRRKEGRGCGTGSLYLPYIYIHDVASIGLASRVLGWKTARIHHLLSRLELQYFHTLEWSERVLDIREQFPLDLDETLAIAAQLGVKHPTHPKTRCPIVMTSDFVVTVREPFNARDRVRTTKYAKDLRRPRVLEKLEIERVYWQDVRGIDWKIITERNIDPVLARNVEWVHRHRDARQLAPLTTTDIARVEESLTMQVVRGGVPLAKLTKSCDALLGLSPGSSLSVVRHLIANRRWQTDMRAPISPLAPLNLTAVPTLYAMTIRREATG